MVENYESQFLGFIKQEMKQDLAHDINHVLRVVKIAKYLCETENAVIDVVLPAAYLHDCFSFPKNHPDKAKSSKISADKALSFLRSVEYPEKYFPAISHAIVSHSFSANVKPKTLEAKIVQDADRLDALGAIGIARCIQVNTGLGVHLYSLDDPFCIQREPDDRLHAIDHFFIKLLKLSSNMNTVSAKLEAEKRTSFMKLYLEQLGTEI